jgi:hypothetical protein
VWVVRIVSRCGEWIPVLRNLLSHVGLPRFVVLVLSSLAGSSTVLRHNDLVFLPTPDLPAKFDALRGH